MKNKRELAKFLTEKTGIKDQIYFYDLLFEFEEQKLKIKEKPENYNKQWTVEDENMLKNYAKSHPEYNTLECAELLYRKFKRTKGAVREKLLDFRGRYD